MTSKINPLFFENLSVLPYRCSKIIPSFFTIKEGSTSHLGLLPSGKKRETALQCYICPTCPSPAGGSLTHSQALALSKRARDVTAPPVALNRCAIRLAGHQSPRQFFVRDGTAWRSLAKTNGYKGLDHWDKVTGALSNLLIACRFSAIFLVVSIK